MNLLFISGSYPTPKAPQKGVFLQQMVLALAAAGHNCVVISPLSIFKYHASGLRSLDYQEKVAGKGQVWVLRPLYLSASNKKMGFFNTAYFTQHNFIHAVRRVIRKRGIKADLLYGLFMFPGGGAASVLGRELNLPSVVEVGEGVFWTIRPFNIKWAKRKLAGATAFRPLGRHLYRELNWQLSIPEEKMRVIPNGVDNTSFFPTDRKAAREKCGLPQEKFIVLFVGTFNDDKGGKRLLAALEEIPDCYAVMIGAGPLLFSSDRILYQGLVRHEDLPVWYNSADIFVLPTRVEGCCNAAIEAMCCGLPMVTSDKEHMADIAGPENALTVDEMSVPELAAAIRKLKNDGVLRKQLATGALKKAADFYLSGRVGELTTWFEELAVNHE